MPAGVIFKLASCLASAQTRYPATYPATLAGWRIRSHRDAFLPFWLFCWYSRTMHPEEKRRSAILAAALDGTIVEPPEKRAAHGIVISTPNHREVAFEVKWAGEGWPQDVRAAAADVAEPWPLSVVLLARRLSPGSIEWLRARGANWADAAGNARILGPDGLVVIREPLLRPSEEQPQRRFAWSRSAIVTAEAILAREDRALRATELAGTTGWSVPQTANVLAAFDAQRWTVKRGTPRGRGSSRQLIDPSGMLAAWSEAIAQQQRTTRLAHRARSETMGLLRDDLAPALNAKLSWAVSGWAGLELAAPFATTTPSLHIYIADTDFAGPLSEAIEKAGLHEVDEGGRVTFWSADARALNLAWRAQDIPIVSAPRLYADLSMLGARGQDGADHVREQLIDPLRTDETPGEERSDG